MFVTTIVCSGKLKVQSSFGSRAGHLKTSRQAVPLLSKWFYGIPRMLLRIASSIQTSPAMYSRPFKPLSRRVLIASTRRECLVSLASRSFLPSLQTRRYAHSKHPQGFSPPDKAELHELRERVQEFCRMIQTDFSPPTVLMYY